MNVDFERILFIATLITGAVMLLDWLIFAPKRKRTNAHMSLIVDYSRSFFPVLLIVFLLRSFLFEPFRIPSGSLEPTLLMGDFILVNKYDYGVRLPIVHKKIIKHGEPQRGDIIVFRWPPNPSIDFIKRVVGLPGDKISYIGKELYINGEKISQEAVVSRDNTSQQKEFSEDLLGVKHDIYIDPEKTSRDFTDIEVPEGMYFVMGDNRDDSADSRFWGFVPEENIVGKAVLVWLSWDADKTGLRWNRLGMRIE